MGGAREVRVDERGTDAEVEVDAIDARSEALLRIDARSEGGGGAVRRAGGEVVVADGGRAGNFGGVIFRRAIAFSQSLEMRADVVGLARDVDADSSSKDSAELPVICWGKSAAPGLVLGSDRETEWKEETEEPCVWPRPDPISSVGG
jgi:hypothetical protein